MKVLINSVDGEIFSLDVTPQTTVRQLKVKFKINCSTYSFCFQTKITEGIEAETDFYLTHGTQILDADDSSLEQLEISDMATLNCSARLLGGKVHGSLARAGKVRAQTPKVDKQEKKKKKRGKLIMLRIDFGAFNNIYIKQIL